MDSVDGHAGEAALGADDAPAEPAADAPATGRLPVEEPDVSAGAAANPVSETRIPRFGARKVALRLREELASTRASLERIGGLDYEQVQHAIKEQREELDRLNEECAQAEAKLAEVRERIVVTEDVEMLQQVGVYEYRHPLSDATAYQSALKQLQGEIRVMARADGGAVTGSTSWTVNNSLAQGRKMVRETSKLMLRAYNAEADNLVRGLKPYKLESALARLNKVAATIDRLGQTLSIQVSPEFHRLRTRELETTADFLAMKAEEKERERAERERLREERKVQREMEQERKRLEKERAHYANALEALLAKQDEDGAARLRDQIAEIERGIEDVDYRAANIRAGYVYVISNLGAFGDDVVKIGLTRRLEPLERVRELGDASVPFRYDVHALFFSKDAVGIEQELHKRLADRRMNRVNLRREFFRITPAEIKTHLADLAGELLEFTDTPEALEYRQSRKLAAATTQDSPDETQ